MRKHKQRTTTASKVTEARAEGIAEASRYAVRLRRVEHELEELRTRLNVLARHAVHHTPEGIRNAKDLWAVSLEAMAERARHIEDVAAGRRG